MSPPNTFDDTKLRPPSILNSNGASPVRAPIFITPLLSELQLGSVKSSDKVTGVNGLILITSVIAVHPLLSVISN